MTPSNPEDARYTLTELADLAGVTPRTVRYYLGQGLLPAVGVAGPGAKYDDVHLARLRLIRRLQAQHQPLAEIRSQLASLDDLAILAIAGEPTTEPPADSALDYIRRITRPAHLASEVGVAGLYRKMRPIPVTASIAPTAPAAPAPNIIPDPISRMDRSQWERIALGPDVELHIRRPLPRSTAKRVDRLVEIARDLLEEDRS
ncbi:MAG: MerR family transcriptional regulator [Candidatus Limnocylindrales bacterium]